MVAAVALVLAFAVSAVFAEADITFPEIARERSSRIVSGWEANDGQFPFQMSLRMVNPQGGVSACGATIIHSEWGLTAAHCTAGRITMVLRAGVVNLTLPYYIFETTEYFNHPQYDNSIPSIVQPHDIGLLKFGRSIEFNELVQPIRLQRSEAKDANYENVQLIASGWGRTWTGGSSPENLNWVYLSGVSNQYCWTAFGGSSIIVPSTICASGYNVTSQSTCQGDSGGSLTVIDDDGNISQIGISSFVSALGCHADMPAGFIRPGHYHDWIKEVTGIDFDWKLDIGTTTEVVNETTTTSASPDESEEDEEEIECEDEDDEATKIRVVNN